MIILITGSYGSGKTTLAQSLIQDTIDGVWHGIYTGRKDEVPVKLHDAHLPDEMMKDEIHRTHLSPWDGYDHIYVSLTETPDPQMLGAADIVLAVGRFNYETRYVRCEKNRYAEDGQIIRFKVTGFQTAEWGVKTNA